MSMPHHRSTDRRVTSLRQRDAIRPCSTKYLYAASPRHNAQVRRHIRNRLYRGRLTSMKASFAILIEHLEKCWSIINFGESDGQPRQEADPMLQRRGYRDAITYLALRNDIDASRKAHSVKLPWPRRHRHHQRPTYA